jgi:putative methionine-R-sulfoxide reductase with GAF domain
VSAPASTRGREYAAIVRSMATLPRAAGRDERMRAVVDSLWDSLSMTGVSWVGFYIDQPGEPADRRLVLGPCRNSPACSPIALHGACGSCLRSGRPLIVRDVRELGENYIACDPRDRSEVVVPLFGDGSCWGVLDLDSHEVGSFDDVDAEGLRRVLLAAGLTS